MICVWLLLGPESDLNKAFLWQRDGSSRERKVRFHYLRTAGSRSVNIHVAGQLSNASFDPCYAGLDSYSMLA